MILFECSPELKAKSKVRGYRICTSQMPGSLCTQFMNKKHMVVVTETLDKTSLTIIDKKTIKPLDISTKIIPLVLEVKS